MKRLDMNDPRLTTFALGELEGEEAIEMAKLVESDPAAKKYVEEIRETAAMISVEFQNEKPAREEIPLRLLPEEREKIFAAATLQPWWKRWHVMVPGAGLATLAIAVLTIVYHPEPENFTAKVGTISQSTDYTVEGGNPHELKASMKIPPSSAAAVESYSQQAGAQVPAEMQNSPKADMIEAEPAQSNLANAETAEAPADMAQPRLLTSPKANAASIAARPSGEKSGPQKEVTKTDIFSVFGGSQASDSLSQVASKKAESGAGDLIGSGGVGAEERKGAQGIEAAGRGAGTMAALNAPIVMKKGKDVDPGFAGHQQSAKSSASNNQNRGGMGPNIIESQWLRPQEVPVSTFWIDVGTASYEYVRQSLKGNQLPLTYKVRTEELYNSFKYDYPQPTDQQSYSVTTEVATSPFSPQNKIVRIGLQGRANQKLQNSGANIEVTFNPKSVSSYRLIGFDMRHYGETSSKNENAGVNNSRRMVTALYEVFPAGPNLNGAELMSVKLRNETTTSEKTDTFEVSVINTARTFEEASSDLKFASAVAGFGMHLRGSTTTGEMTYDRVIELASKNSKFAGKVDRNRLEFVELARTAKQLSSKSNKNR